LSLSLHYFAKLWCCSMPSNSLGSAWTHDVAARLRDSLFTAKAVTKRLMGPTASAWIARYRWRLMCHWQSWRRIEKPSDPRWLDVLDDPGFRASMAEVADLSSLDTARLANLWQWCSLCGEGAMIEIGAFRGGTALHLSNCRPQRKIFVCDTFEGFARLPLDPRYDAGVPRTSWCNPDADAVKALFTARGRDAVVLEGPFPDSDTKEEVRDVSFAHIDVDVYESCRRSLEYLSRRATPSAIFVVNDYLRSKTAGVAHAVNDFVAGQPDWIALPTFPGQGLLLNRVTYGRSCAHQGADLA
jgi:Macrocin-O-methyltransferase (TylF)